MVMAEHALVAVQFLIRQFMADQAGSIARVIAAQFREDSAQRRGEVNESAVLLRREIVLHELLALDLSPDRFWTSGPAKKTAHANPTIAKTRRDGDARFAV